MHWEEIEAALGPAERRHLLGWKKSYQADFAGEEVDPSAFVRWLHDSGLITTAQFRQIHDHRRVGARSQAETLMAETTMLPDDLDGDAVDTVSLEGDAIPDLPSGPPYEMVGRLAAGAMGEILIVNERDLRRQVALKRMHPGLAGKPRLARRFLHEAQITAQLEHPNIVPVYSLIANNETVPAYTMKLVRGQTFAELIAEARQALDDGANLPPELDSNAFLEHFVRACDAIAYAHSRGVVHRDLKPENIMVGAYGEVYVMDWGIARVMGSREGTTDAVELGSTDAHRTRLGAVLGTPAYMSPEQALGQNDQLDGRSDVFALGLILTELVSLRAAASGRDTKQLVGRMRKAKLEPLRHYREGQVLPAAMVAVIGRCTRERPMERYPTAGALAADVRRFLRGEPVSALPESVAQRAGRWIGAHRVLALSALIGLLSIAATVTITSLGSTLYTVRAASYREAVLSELQSEVAERGRTLDARFQTLPALLEALATAALQALALPNTPEGAEGMFYLDIRASPDLTQSSVYQRPISLNHPNTVLPLDTPLEARRPALRRLATLGPAFRRTLVAAHDGDLASMRRSERMHALRNQTSPVRWVYLALESGVGLSYPGHPGVPPGLDLRDEPWYAAASGPRAVWGETRRTTTDSRSLLPVSKAIFDEDGWRLGVVALEVGLEEEVGDLLALPLRGEDTTAVLLDGEGYVVLSTDPPAEPTSSRRSRWLRRPMYDDEAVLAGIEANRDGHLEVVRAEGGVDLVVWSHMGALGWTYVVRGARDDLMR
jgi:serine/threonine-protein kinase